MTHPIELLADEVDGTLDPGDREALHDHLRSCASCRDDARLAASARKALRSVPPVEAPDIAAGFTPERIAAIRASAPSASVTATRSPWSRVAPTLAAAAIVGAVALVLPRVVRSPDAVDRASAPAAETVIDGARPLQIDDTDYDAAALDRLAASLAASLTADPGSASAPSTAEAAAEPGATANDQGFDGAARLAAACLERAFPQTSSEIVQVRRATYQGRPAYLGIVVEGVRPAVRVTIRVAAVDDCSRLALTS
ncbi:MAG TPA: zf-HC2 domain-containing protein [Actinomycetota bacterium]|nr:zf-HC2 domain-containing protein [Actinomycetota bacterium]